jgi:hypothetical protein
MAMAVTQEPEVAVIGAGIIGLSVAYTLVERGVAVRVYEHSVPGNGQSGGESRIFWHAHDDPRLAAFARDSRRIWSKWEGQLGVKLISPGGAVAIGAAVEDRWRVLEQVGGVPARSIDSAELSERLPLLASYSGPAMLDEAGGSIRTQAAIAALAGELGASLVADEVISIRPLAQERVEVRTGGGASTTRAWSSAPGAAPRGWHVERGSRSPSGSRRTSASPSPFEATRRRDSPACKMEAATSGRSGPAARRSRATAATRWASARPSTCGRMAVSWIPLVSPPSVSVRAPM